VVEKPPSTPPWAVACSHTQARAPRPVCPVPFFCAAAGRLVRRTSPCAVRGPPHPPATPPGRVPPTPAALGPEDPLPGRARASQRAPLHLLRRRAGLAGRWLAPAEASCARLRPDATTVAASPSGVGAQLDLGRRLVAPSLEGHDPFAPPIASAGRARFVLAGSWRRGAALMNGDRIIIQAS